MIKATASMVLLGLLTVSVGAQELSVDKSKLYVTDPVACQKLQDAGVDAFNDTDFLAMSLTDGIQGMEFNCNFMDVKGQKGSSFLFVSAVCEAPGEVYPDTLSISPYDETTVQVVSSYDAMMVSSGNAEPPGPTTNPGVTLYHRCDNLSELPR